SFPKFLLMKQRGEIELARSNIRGALADFEDAAARATVWRRETLPAVETFTTTNIDLERQVFRALVDTSAHEAVVHHDPRLALRAFQALEQNRAASLRDSVATNWRNGIPVQYWDRLDELRSEQAKAVQNRGTEAALVSAKTKLTEMEAQIGLRTFSDSGENFRSQNSLIHFRQV